MNGERKLRYFDIENNIGPRTQLQSGVQLAHGFQMKNPVIFEAHWGI